MMNNSFYISGTHAELIKDPEGAYSQLVQLQQGNGTGTDTDPLEYDEISSDEVYNLEPDRMDRSKSQRSSSMGKLITRNSISSQRSFRLSNGISGPINTQETVQGLNKSYSQRDVMGTLDKSSVKKQDISVWRLAQLNKPELPVILLGCIGAILHGMVFPAFGILISTMIKIFYQPPDILRKDSRKWALVIISFASVTLFAVPLQNYFFGVAGGKLIQRVRALCFRKIVHQEISWFDEPANSRYTLKVHSCRVLLFNYLLYSKCLQLNACFVVGCSGAVGARLSTDAAAVKTIVGDALALVIQNIATVVAGLIIAFTANWRLALIILAVSPVLLVQGVFQARFTKGFSAEAKVDP